VQRGNTKTASQPKSFISRLASKVLGGFGLLPPWIGAEQLDIGMKYVIAMTRFFLSEQLELTAGWRAKRRYLRKKQGEKNGNNGSQNGKFLSKKQKGGVSLKNPKSVGESTKQSLMRADYTQTQSWASWLRENGVS
jgi:hypothetical protein